MSDDVFRISTVQEVAVAAASARTTNAFGAQTYAVRVVSSTVCRFVIGDGAVAATATDSYLPAGIAETFRCTPGQKAAFIRETADGKATVTELTL